MNAFENIANKYRADESCHFLLIKYNPKRKNKIQKFSYTATAVSYTHLTMPTILLV